MLAKAHVTFSGPAPHPLLTQELSLGEGELTVADGDAAELKYTGWIFNQGELGQVSFKSNV